jgi:2-polyprenyl-3-methyl-5-hydroxy-6-metoxy-1,4-benzoquinol methylase
MAEHDEAVQCNECSRVFAVRDGTLRMTGDTNGLSEPETRERTAESFAFEWQRFGQIREVWEKNFLDYMQPHGPSFFNGLRVLDAGTGSGRHARQAALYGATVAAIDLGDSIDVARANVPESVLTVQADLEVMPFEPHSFDFVVSIGVLHHLPDTQQALDSLVQFVRPGGRIRIYVYWQPERRWHRSVLRAVGIARTVTTRLPHRLLEALCYPLAAGLWVGIVLPYKLLRNSGRASRIAESLPLKTYADYPFRWLVSDQFDRLSAPIERRYTASQVEDMMRGAGLRDVTVIPNAGWVAEGQTPPSTDV